MYQHPKSAEAHSGAGIALENGMAAPELRPESESRNEPDTIEVLLVLAREKNRILQIILAAALLATVVSLLLPKMYTATTTLLPPRQKQSALNLMVGQIGALGKLSEAGDLGLKDPADLFVAMLKARTIEDNLINRFDLRKVYWVARYQDARKKLESRSNISAGDEGVISISVTDRDPKRAAEIANAYVEELHNLNQNLALTEAAQRRLFFEREANAERESLSRAELALKQVQEKNGLFQPEAQGRTIIASEADLRAQIASHEVQLRTMRSYATANNPDLKRAETELSGLRGQLAKLEHNSSADLGNGNIGIPARQFPQAELEYLRRARELKYHEALDEFLGKQLEAARIDEGQNAILVQVVDPAVEPERKSSPRRLLIVLASAGLAFILACVGVLFLEALRRKQQDPNERARLALLRHSLKFSL